MFRKALHLPFFTRPLPYESGPVWDSKKYYTKSKDFLLVKVGCAWYDFHKHNKKRRKSGSILCKLHHASKTQFICA